MSPPGFEHGRVELRIASELLFQGERRGLGVAFSGEAGVVLRKEPARVVGVDAAFLTPASLPVRRSPEGYLESIPDLVVEVLSKNDSRPYVARKVADYLAAGVKVVWLADPSSRTIVEHRPAREPVVYDANDLLTVEDLIPGFRMQVADAFAE
jgi:Uma2 family endonuclease